MTTRKNFDDDIDQVPLEEIPTEKVIDPIGSNSITIPGLQVGGRPVRIPIKKNTKTSFGVHELEITGSCSEEDKPRHLRNKPS